MRPQVVWMLIGSVYLFPATLRTAAAHSPETHAVERSNVCMLEDRVQKGAGIEASYQGKTYYVCATCSEAFHGETDRYASARDPVTGKMVDKATAPLLTYRGRVFFFESEMSLDAFALDPMQHARSRN